MRKIINKLSSFLFTISVMVLTITFSIGLPIYVRPFYYAHVEILDLDEQWDLEKEYIIEAYDEVLDFLTLEGREFGAGVLPFSEEGAGHFADCKVLFDLNKNAFVVALIAFVSLLLLNKLGIIKLSRPRGYGLSYHAGLSTLILFATIALLAAQNFSVAFTIFHLIFFPGKDNWLFDPNTDPIILFMPQKFFMNCAILICASILIISIVLIARGKKKRIK
jgi:integral membrane protein (TIGR01906 family)